VLYFEIEHQAILVDHSHGHGAQYRGGGRAELHSGPAERFDETGKRRGQLRGRGVGRRVWLVD
jgi:hypothetical protein